MMVVLNSSSVSSNLASLFHPRSIAVIGASDKPYRIGFHIVKNLVEGKFTGPIYPVNPRLSQLLGLRAYPTIETIPNEVDLGIIVLRKDRVIDAVDACNRKGVPALILMSSGFSELGDLVLEKEVVKRVKKYKMRMLGPNCAGFVAPWNQIYASFENRVEPGNIGFISQSGAMCAVISALIRAEALGFSMFISYGNAADVGPEEALQYLGAHEHTQLIGCYVEGLHNARSFFSVAQTITPHKPIVILKPGDTPATVKAIQSHTGALAGEHAIYTGAFRQSGVLQVRTLYEFIDACKVLVSQPLPRGNRLAIVTNAGGPGVLAVDASAQTTLNISPFSSSLIQQFTEFLPQIGPMDNPVDLGPESNAQIYQRVVEILLSSAEVDLVLVLCTPPRFLGIRSISQAIVSAKKDKEIKPLVTCWLTQDLVEKGLPLLARKNIPHFPTPQRAIQALDYLALRSQWLRHHLPRNNEVG